MNEFVSTYIPVALLTFLIAAASWFTGNRWERRKLSRNERAVAYSNFLDALNRRWAAFQDRDQLIRSSDFRRFSGSNDPDLAASWDEANERVKGLREEVWSAFTIIQVLGSPASVTTAQAVVELYDRRNASYFKPKSVQGVGSDERSVAQKRFIAAARHDLEQRPVELSTRLPE